MEDALKCHVCLCNFDENTHKPYLLPKCGHSICKFCLNQLLAQSASKSCPECRKPNALEPENNLPVNYNLLQVVQNYLEKNSSSSVSTEEKGTRSSSHIPLPRSSSNLPTPISSSYLTTPISSSYLTTPISSSYLTSPISSLHLVTPIGISNLNYPSSSSYANCRRRNLHSPTEISSTHLNYPRSNPHLPTPKCSSHLNHQRSNSNSLSSRSRSKNTSSSLFSNSGADIHTNLRSSTPNLSTSDGFNNFMTAEQLQEEIDFQMAIHLTFCKDPTHKHDQIPTVPSWSYPNDEDINVALKNNYS